MEADHGIASLEIHGGSGGGIAFWRGRRASRRCAAGAHAADSGTRARTRRRTLPPDKKVGQAHRRRPGHVERGDQETRHGSGRPWRAPGPGRPVSILPGRRRARECTSADVRPLAMVMPVLEDSTRRPPRYLPSATTADPDHSLEGMRFGACHVADRRVGIGALSNSFVAASRTLEFARRYLHHATLGCYTSVDVARIRLLFQAFVTERQLGGYPPAPASTQCTEFIAETAVLPACAGLA